MWVTVNRDIRRLLLTAWFPTVLSTISIHRPSPYPGHPTIPEILTPKCWVRLPVPVNLQLNVFNGATLLDYGDVPSEPCVTPIRPAWKEWRWQSYITKRRGGFASLKLEHITEEDTPPEINEAHGARTSSYWDDLAVVMLEVAAILESMLVFVH
jgi:hypothetical protein